MTGDESNFKSITDLKMRKCSVCTKCAIIKGSITFECALLQWWVGGWQGRHCRVAVWVGL